MKRSKICFLLIMIMFNNFFSKAQDKGSSDELVNREPCVAGQFYPGTERQLKSELKTLFAEASPAKVSNTLAIISPHAGYVFSGGVAASAFNQIDPEKKYDRIFVIGSSHRTYFDGASIYNAGHYDTPLGTVRVDLDLAGQLIDKYPVFSYRRNAHSSEHSLEVQVPFLQYHMKKDFKIVPIVIATQSTKTIKKISEALEPYFNEKNLFVISSDFSHYPPYDKAVEVDQNTATAIASNSTEIFLGALKENEKQGIPNLSTSMCGWSAMLMLLNLTENRDDIEIRTLEYKNSGDASYGDKTRVVGYWAIAVAKKKSEPLDGFSIGDEEKSVLLDIARRTIDTYIKTGQVPLIDADTLPESLRTHTGAFVTLKKDRKLRGCIGRFQPNIPLYEVVQDMAVAAATRDSRFSPVKHKELKKIHVEISVLTPLRKIRSIDEIELGRHGIYIKKGFLSGTFLPQVAVSTGWNLEEFLGHCARDKARIGWEGWKDADIYVYEAIVFSEKKPH